jgi:hypothetical protein
MNCHNTTLENQVGFSIVELTSNQFARAKAEATAISSRDIC